MKKISSLLLCAVMLITAFPLASFAEGASSGASRLPFEDVPENAWFYGTVAEAYESGLIKGRSETVFAPGDNVTRAEVAAMLSRLDGADDRGFSEYASAFSDVKDGAWYRGCVGWAASADILRGYPDGTVKPGADVTRAELAAMIKRYVDRIGAELPADPKTDSFSDSASFREWFSAAAEEMRVTGLLNGYKNGEMMPSAPATRAEVATVLVRLGRSVAVAESTVLLASAYRDTRALLIYDRTIETGTRRYAAYVENLIDVVKEGTGYELKPYSDALPHRKNEIVLACSRTESEELCEGLAPLEFRIRVVADEKGASLFLGYSNHFSYKNAVGWLVSNYLRNGELRVPKDLDYSERVPGLYEGRDYTIIESGIPQLRDPFVLVEDGVYYMYGTGWIMYKNTSGDLSGPWEGPYRVVETPSDFKADYWAPEVYKYNGKYWLFTSYIAVGSEFHGITVFSSDSPEGPFRLVSDGIITTHESDNIDATVYFDKNGDPWLAYSLAVGCPTTDGLGRIYAARLAEDFKSLVSEPIALFMAYGSPLATTSRESLCEGPFLWGLEDGSLIAIWSGLDDCGYAVGIARSDNGEVTGNWVHEEIPIFSQSLTGIYDGGHGMIFRGLDGELYLTVHAPNIWDASMIGPDGRGAMPIFIRIREENGTVVWDIPE